MQFVARSYQGIEDLAPMCALAGATLKLRDSCSYWHPGDLVWMMYTHSHMNLFDPYADIRLWFDADGRCVAIAWFYAAQHVRFEIHPAHHDALADELREWMETHCRTLNSDKDRLILSSTAHDADSARLDMLTAAGYQVVPDRVEVVLCCDLSEIRSMPTPPTGMSVHDCVVIDEHARAACHRDAWSSLDHIGRPKQVSQFHDPIYQALRTASRYDPALDLVVEDDAGEYATCCIAWVDEVSRTGVFEPVGTRPAWRGLQLSALLNETAMVLLRERGMERALVVSSEDNNPTAWRAYRRLFEPLGRIRYYYKTL